MHILRLYIDPINKVQVLYPENPLGESMPLPNNTDEPLIKDSAADSDNSLESDDSDNEGSLRISFRRNFIITK